MSITDWLDDALQALERQSLRRQLTVRTSATTATIVCDGRRCHNFGANDYLGLANDDRVRQAARDAIDHYGWGSGASPLIIGRTALHAALESQLAAFEQTEAALLFPTGYAANLAVIASLVGSGDTIFSDAKNHASIIDGCRLSGAQIVVYPHRDLDALARQLASQPTGRRRLVVSDGLFSMDGDLAPIAELVELCQQYEAMLLIDEAHATGVLGREGRGACEACEADGPGVIRVGTLSKALGSLGGFVVAERRLIDWIISRGRPYIFSTAAPPAACAAASAALDVVRHEPGRRQTLLSRAASLRRQLQQQGLVIGSSHSQIIPVILGDADRTTTAARRLRELGYLVPGIRPPSVPRGESLLRISLSYLHTEEVVTGLIRALSECLSSSTEGDR